MSKIEKAYSMTNIGSVAPLSKSEVLIGQGHKTDLTTQLGLRGLCRSSLWVICSMMKISTLHALKKIHSRNTTKRINTLTCCRVRGWIKTLFIEHR